MNFLLFVMKFVLVSPTFILSCIDTGNLREVCVRSKSNGQMLQTPT